MTVGVLTAVTDAAAESALTAALAASRDEVSLVRRCVDLAEVLAVAATGSVQVAVVSADLRRLDRASVAKLSAAGIRLILLADAGPSAVRSRQLGADLVLAPDASATVVIDAIRQLGAQRGTPVATAAPEDSPAVQAVPVSAGPTLGQVIAVWGPTGAPGRTTVALNLAAELAGRGLPVLLVDADPTGGTVAQLVGMTQDVPGLIGAAMAANNGLLDADRLASFARDLGAGASRLRLLTGLPRPDRWPELRPAGLESVLAVARELAAVTVVDCGFCLDGGQPGMFESAASGPGAVTRAVLSSADVVIAVGSADPCGLVRLTQGLAMLAEVADTTPLVVANRVRSGALPSGGAADVRAALRARCGLDPAALIPYALAELDQAAATGRLLAETAPDGAIATALSALADLLVGTPDEGVRRRRSRMGGRFRRGQGVGRMTARLPELTGRRE